LASGADDDGYGDDDFEEPPPPAASPAALTASMRAAAQSTASVALGFEARRADVDKLVNKFIRLVTNEPDNGWEEDCDALSKESFALYMEEYRGTFEGALRLSACVNDASLQGQLLFEAVFDSIDSGGSGALSKAQFRKYFLESKALEQGLVVAGDASAVEDEDEGYGDDDFEEVPTPVVARIGRQTSGSDGDADEEPSSSELTATAASLPGPLPSSLARTASAVVEDSVSTLGASGAAAITFERDATEQRAVAERSAEPPLCAPSPPTPPQLPHAPAAPSSLVRPDAAAWALQPAWGCASPTVLAAEKLPAEDPALKSVRLSISGFYLLA
jgi:hypothetical protein